MKKVKRERDERCNGEVVEVRKSQQREEGDEKGNESEWKIHDSKKDINWGGKRNKGDNPRNKKTETESKDREPREVERGKEGEGKTKGGRREERVRRSERQEEKMRTTSGSL